MLVRNTDSNTGFRFRLNGKTLQIYKADESVGVNVDNIFHSSSYMMTRLTKLYFADDQHQYQIQD